MKKLQKVYYIMKELGKISLGHQLIPISWNKPNNFNKPNAQKPPYVYCLCKDQRNWCPRADGRGVCLMHVILANRSQVRLPHTPNFCFDFIFLIFFLQNFKIS